MPNPAWLLEQSGKLWTSPHHMKMSQGLAIELCLKTPQASHFHLLFAFAKAKSSLSQLSWLSFGDSMIDMHVHTNVCNSMGFMHTQWANTAACRMQACPTMTLQYIFVLRSLYTSAAAFMRTKNQDSRSDSKVFKNKDCHLPAGWISHLIWVACCCNQVMVSLQSMIPCVIFADTSVQMHDIVDLRKRSRPQIFPCYHDFHQWHLIRYSSTHAQDWQDDVEVSKIVYQNHWHWDCIFSYKVIVICE